MHPGTGQIGRSKLRTFKTGPCQIGPLKTSVREVATVALHCLLRAQLLHSFGNPVGEMAFALKPEGLELDNRPRDYKRRAQQGGDQGACAEIGGGGAFSGGKKTLWIVS